MQQSAHDVEMNPHTGTGSWMPGLPPLLRGLGGIALLTAIGSFLFQRWDTANDLYRFVMLLAFTAGLTVIGFASGHWIREGKGARLLVSIALAAVPANFAVLAAFFYRHWAWDGALTSYPAVATWSLPDPGGLLGVLALALAVLLPVTWLGFMVLSRSSALRLSMVFLINAAALLLPVRESGWVALVLGVIGALTLWQLAAKGGRRLTAPTPEGAIATALLFVPHGILLGRSLWLYSPGALLGLVMMLTLFLGLRQFALALRPGSSVHAALNGLALVPAMLAGGFLWVALAPFADTGGAALVLPAAGLLNAALVFELSLRETDNAGAFRWLAAGSLVFALLGNLLLFGNGLSAALCLLGGVGLVVAGYLVRQSLVLGLGVATLVVGLLNQSWQLFAHFDLFSWGSLAVLGVAAILVASLIDRHGVRMRARFAGMRRELAAWDW